MDSETLAPFLGVLRAIEQHLSVIADALAADDASLGPNFQRRLSEYPDFDWASIDAMPVKRDEHGVTLVQWRGQEYTRRRHADYDASVWFSRYTGRKDENDRKVYARLVTFSARPRVVKSLPAEVSERLPERADRKPAGADRKPAGGDSKPAASTPSPDPSPVPVVAPDRQSKPVGPTPFWKAVGSLKAAGKIPGDMDVRREGIVQDAIKSSDFARALAWLKREFDQ